MSIPNLPIALRPVGNYPVKQGSIFEDPGDEKSWHRSQRSESLDRFYEGREPSWYASAIRPLAGADRVLDLGCGPGLTLRALLEQGATSVLGVDRWPSFAAGGSAETPIVMHDLTLPMPFLPSGSFDGVLSHYALDYVSPVGMRQVLREALRLLAPGGQLLIYVAAIGLGSGDETRTVPYSATAMSSLLEDAGFTDLDVEASPNGRNTVARARCPVDSHARAVESPEVSIGDTDVSVAVRGDTQLSAAFVESRSMRIEVSVLAAGGECSLGIEIDRPSGARISVCSRITQLPGHGSELQVWAWRDREFLAAETLRFEMVPESIRIRHAGEVEFAGAWAPDPLAIEATGSAYISASEVDSAEGLDEPGRGSEGRRIVVEDRRLDGAEIQRTIGVGANRFLIRRPEPSTGIGEIDSDWTAGKALGVVVGAEALANGQVQPICQWAGVRQALLLVEGATWDEVSTAVRAQTNDISGPLLLVDPVLTGGPPGPVPEDLIAHASRDALTMLILDPRTRELTGGGALAKLQGGLLSSSLEVDGPDAAEALRHLTERTILMRLRHAFARPLGDLGRRPSLS